MQQETASFRYTEDSFKKVIVVKDDVPMYRTDSGYLIIGLLDFLLNPELLIKG